MNMHMCRTCAHWNAKYPENRGLGDCERVNVLADPVAVCLTPTDVQPPIREEFPGGTPTRLLRTVADFGCVCWKPR